MQFVNKSKAYKEKRTLPPTQQELLQQSMHQSCVKFEKNVRHVCDWGNPWQALLYEDIRHENNRDCRAARRSRYPVNTVNTHNCCYTKY